MNRAKRIMDKAKADQAKRDDDVRASVLGPVKPINEGDPMDNPQLTGETHPPRFVYDPAKISQADMAKFLDANPGSIVVPSGIEFMPGPIYHLDVPGGGRGLIVCDDPVDADAIKRSFQVRRMPMEACTYGANLKGERFGLIIVAKRPQDDGQERWLTEVVAPCLVEGGTLRKLYV